MMLVDCESHKPDASMSSRECESNVQLRVAWDLVNYRPIWQILRLHVRNVGINMVRVGFGGIHYLSVNNIDAFITKRGRLTKGSTSVEDCNGVVFRDSKIVFLLIEVGDVGVNRHYLTIDGDALQVAHPSTRHGAFEHKGAQDVGHVG